MRGGQAFFFLIAVIPPISFISTPSLSSEAKDSCYIYRDFYSNAICIPSDKNSACFPNISVMLDFYSGEIRLRVIKPKIDYRDNYTINIFGEDGFQIQISQILNDCHFNLKMQIYEVEEKNKYVPITIDNIQNSQYHSFLDYDSNKFDRKISIWSDTTITYHSSYPCLKTGSLGAITTDGVFLYMFRKSVRIYHDLGSRTATIYGGGCKVVINFE